MSLLGLDLGFASGGDRFLVSVFGDGCSLCFDWWFLTEVYGSGCCGCVRFCWQEVLVCE